VAFNPDNNPEEGAMNGNFLNDPGFFDNICEHFVCISGTYIRIDDSGKRLGGEEHFAYSAFVIDINGTWCLVTAGHVIDQINKALHCPNIRFGRITLADFFNVNAKIAEATPFPYQEDQAFRMDQDGMDVGLLPLGVFYRESLKSNGVIPIPIGGWNGDRPHLCDAYALVGLPEERITKIAPTAMRGSGITVQLTVVGLNPVVVPPDTGVSRFPRFAAVLSDDGELCSPVGMSGGPILGMRRTEGGNGQYTCIAIQGSWDRERRMVFGTPIAIVVGPIKVALDYDLQTEGYDADVAAIQARFRK
jgi:hypothetical protein